MKIKKLGALLVSAALCAGMAAPAFAFEGEAAPVEQPVLPEVVEEDVVTITDETSGALTPEGNLTLVDDYHTDYSDGSGQRSRIRGGVGRLPQQGGKLFRRDFCSPHHLVDLGGILLLNAPFQNLDTIVQFDAAFLLFFQHCPQLIEFFAHFFLQSF